MKKQTENLALSHDLREAINLQKIEDNPLTAEEVSMFEMFEREGLSHEQRRDYITRHLHKKHDRKNVSK